MALNSHDPRAAEMLDQLARALPDGSAGRVEEYARVDLHRVARKGVPEVILAERKTPEQTVAIAHRMLDTSGRAIISRVPDATIAALEAAFRDGYAWRRGTANQVIVLRRPDLVPMATQGVVGIICAGTSDLPVAE